LQLKVSASAHRAALSDSDTLIN